jgi:hypothetical protein
MNAINTVYLRKGKLLDMIKVRGGITLIDGYFKVGSDSLREYIELAFSEEMVRLYSTDDVFTVRETDSTKLSSIHGRKLCIECGKSNCVILDGAWVGNKRIVKNFITVGIML